MDALGQRGNGAAVRGEEAALRLPELNRARHALLADAAGRRRLPDGLGRSAGVRGVDELPLRARLWGLVLLFHGLPQQQGQCEPVERYDDLGPSML